MCMLKMIIMISLFSFQVSVTSLIGGAEPNQLRLELRLLVATRHFEVIEVSQTDTVSN